MCQLDETREQLKGEPDGQRSATDPDAMTLRRRTVEHVFGTLKHWMGSTHFQTLQQARSAITLWRHDYNEVRPHSSCVRMPPAKVAELHRQRAGDATQTSSTTIEIN